MNQEKGVSNSDIVLSVVLRIGMIALVMMVTVGVSVFLGFASDSPSAPKQPIDQALLSLKLFAFSGIALAFTPMRLFQSKNFLIKAVIALLILLFLQPVVVIPRALGHASAPAA